MNELMLENVKIPAYNNTFYAEVKDGLLQKQKTLPSKYFYDATGDKLFQQIMILPEYYPSRCEMEILITQTAALTKAITSPQTPFDLIELGAGDGIKTFHLLKHLTTQQMQFKYVPVDISTHILLELQNMLHDSIPELDLEYMQGEYLTALSKAIASSDRRKVVLFMGANIGNFSPAEAISFCENVREMLAPGDLFIIGFDLKKDPRLIRNAYDDSQGITRLFNLNLLTRINEDLGANFSVPQFEHYCNYDPFSGACKSYLVSLCDQRVSFPDYQVLFKKGECIWTEISQKYSQQEIGYMAVETGFKPVTTLTDSKEWFTLNIWEVPKRK